MKIYFNNRRLLKAMFTMLFMAGAALGFSQKKTAIIDVKLGQVLLTDLSGNPLDSDNLYLNQVVMLRLPVSALNHGDALPVGSCKIKIGFGSKLILDPMFSLNDASANNNFKWTASNAGGQLQVTGELISSMSPNTREIVVAVKVQSSRPGSSAITANFLVTNHNTTTILSDEDGANNSSALQYSVSEKVAPVLNESDLKLSLYPNPVSAGKDISIVATSGRFNGKYIFSMMDVAGKVIQTKELVLNDVTTYQYAIGNVAAGKYFIRVSRADDSKAFVLKFEKI